MSQHATYPDVDINDTTAELLLPEGFGPAELRTARRFDCPGHPGLPVIVNAGEVPEVLGVQDISHKGLGLVLREPLDPGVELDILWQYGPVERWRTLHALVVRRAQRHAGEWIVGCMFREPLDEGEEFAFLGYASTCDAGYGR